MRAPRILSVKVLPIFSPLLTAIVASLAPEAHCHSPAKASLASIMKSPLRRRSTHPRPA